ncbi:hypothetical protein [Brachybacterium sp.]|uniref:hypothetical protein n=1 Tax=Brachybacterium sp. TaxID=1891286 RepID=UPI002ED36084
MDIEFSAPGSPTAQYCALIQRNRATDHVGSGMVEAMSADDCVFCRVVAGTVESSRVYEDDEAAEHIRSGMAASPS